MVASVVTVASFDLTIFGETGDLMQHEQFPALYDRIRDYQQRRETAA